MKHNLVTEIAKKPRSSWTDEEKTMMKMLLDGFKQKGIPIYPYIKNREIFFQIVFRNRFIVGYKYYTDAEKVYEELKEGVLTVDELMADNSSREDKRHVTLEDGFNKIMEVHRLAYEAGELKHSSYTKKESDFRLHILPYFKDKPFVKISKADIAKFVDQIRFRETSGHKKDGEERRLSLTMQSELLMYFKMVYKETKRRFDIETTIDIDHEVRLPNLKKTRRDYSKSVEQILKDNYDSKLKKTLQAVASEENGTFNPIFGIDLVTHCTGMRIDEAIALKPSRFSSEENTLTIDRSISWHPNKARTDNSWEETSTKTDSERTIHIAESLALYLEGYIERLKRLSFYDEDMYIFSRLEYARTEEMMLYPFSLKTYVYHLKKAKKRARLMDEYDEKMIKNHIARHAFNNRLKDGGVEQYDREEYLGHSHPSGTNTLYTHGSGNQEKKIVKISEKYCRYLTKDIPEFQILNNR